MSELGDVILYPVTPRSGWTSKFVAIMELLGSAGRGVEPYSHAAIYLNNGLQFEFKWPRSGVFPIDVSRMYEVWRVAELAPNQRDAIKEWCQDHEGEWYNMIGLLSGGLLGLKHTAVCSQGVGQAYAEAAHIHISAEGERLLSPNAIADYPGAKMLARYVPNNEGGA